VMLYTLLPLTYSYTCSLVSLMAQIVVQGDESNPTDCITQYPISDYSADNLGIHIYEKKFRGATCMLSA
jgi:hypothetical protein